MHIINLKYSKKKVFEYESENLDYSENFLDYSENFVTKIKGAHFKIV